MLKDKKYQRNFKSNNILIDEIAYLDASKKKHTLDRKSKVFIKKATLFKKKYGLFKKYIQIRSEINKYMQCH